MFILCKNDYQYLIIMGVVFKYKNKINQSYNPGFVNAGKNGSKGKEGENGNTIHLIDYEIDNAYYLEITLQKIENAQLLTTSYTQNAKLLNDYSKSNYKINDLLLSNSGTCYKLVSSSDNSLFKNFSYDIIKVGKFSSSINEQTPVNIVMYNVTNKEIDKSYAVLNSCYPNHSVKNANLDKDSSFYENDLALKNKYLCFEIAGIVDDNIQIDELTKNYTYSLEINLANTKYVDFGEDPVKKYDEYNNIRFYKKLEFNNIQLIHKNNKPQNLKKYYFVDFNFDSIHPSNNDIKCTLDKNRWMWLNSKLSKDENNLSDIHYYVKTKETVKDDEDVTLVAKTSKDNYIKIMQASCGNTYVENNVNIYSYDSSKSSKELDNFDLGFNTAWYPKNAVGGSLITNSEADIQSAINSSLTYGDNSETNGDILKLSTYAYSGKENILSGNSLYFSSIDESASKEIFASEIINFILNPNNKCYLKITDLRTKSMSLTEVNISII